MTSHPQFYHPPPHRKRIKENEILRTPSDSVSLDVRLTVEFASVLHFWKNSNVDLCEFQPLVGENFSQTLTCLRILLVKSMAVLP